MKECPAYYRLHRDCTEMRHVVEDLRHHRASAMEYIYRSGKKGDKADEIIDLQKAIHHLEMEVETLRDNDSVNCPVHGVFVDRDGKCKYCER